jgi:hypothetical protein
MSNKKPRKESRRVRHTSLRGVRCNERNVRRLGQAAIHHAMQEAAAEAAAEAEARRRKEGNSD